MKRFKSSEMGRREFNSLVGAGAAAALASAGAARASDKTADVGLAGVPRGADAAVIESAARSAAEGAGGFSWLSKGDSVLIKPVVNSGNPYPATTSPEGLAAMIKILREKGAGKVIVSDTSGVEHVKLSPDKLRGSSRELMERSGLARAALESGAVLYFPEEDGWEAFDEVGIKAGSSWKGGVMMPKKTREVDHIVLMPRCGRHLLAGSSLGLKAAVGWWRTDTRLEYHRDASSFQEKTAEANWAEVLLEKQRLTLTIATRVLTTLGPDKGYVVEPETGLVIASSSVTAHDMTSLSWLLMGRDETPESEKKITRDPYSSRTMANSFNKGVVTLLGGPAEAARSEKLTVNDLNTIWDDRVLARAFQLSGGPPRLSFSDVNETVSLGIKEKLMEMTAPKP